MQNKPYNTKILLLNWLTLISLSGTVGTPQSNLNRWKGSFLNVKAALIRRIEKSMVKTREN